MKSTLCRFAYPDVRAETQSGQVLDKRILDLSPSSVKAAEVEAAGMMKMSAANRLWPKLNAILWPDAA